MNKQYIKAYIIEDEPASLENLTQILKKYCQNVLLVGSASSIQDAVEELPVLQPDVVFLDIELPRENGFELFSYFPDPAFDVVFTTAYSEYAIKAFNYSAIHYILKPIDIDELQMAISKVTVSAKPKERSKQIEVWSNVMDSKLNKLVLPTNEGLHFIEVDDVVWCEARSNYTYFYILGNDNILVSKSLKSYEQLLEGKTFFRANRSSLININHILHCSNHRTMEVRMSNGSIVFLSERRRQAFKDIISSKV